MKQPVIIKMSQNLQRPLFLHVRDNEHNDYADTILRLLH